MIKMQLLTENLLSRNTGMFLTDRDVYVFNRIKADIHLPVRRNKHIACSIAAASFSPDLHPATPAFTSM